MIYTVTFNPSLDYIVTVDDFMTGVVNRTSKEIIFPGGKGTVLVRGTYTNIDDDNKPYVIVGATIARRATYINLASIGPSSTRYIELTDFTYTDHTMRQLV